MMDIAIIATDLALYFKLVFLAILRTRITITMNVMVTNTVVSNDLLCTVPRAHHLRCGALTLSASLGVRLLPPLYPWDTEIQGKRSAE